MAAILFLAVPHADAQSRQRVPPSSERGGGQSGGQGGGAREASPRGGNDGRNSGQAAPRTATPRDGGRREAQPAPQPEARGGRDDNRGQRQAAPRDRDPEYRRQAIPRRVEPHGPGIRPVPRYYTNRFYYPRGSFGYGYRDGFRPYGLGYFYYDPFLWSSRGVYYYGGPRYGYDEGELRIDLPQRDAEVYVDGYYAGVVDDFDGVFQSLKLETGVHRIEIAEPGYETLDFEVRITRGNTIHYRADLLPRR
jgi:hypothetical protein